MPNNSNKSQYTFIIKEFDQLSLQELYKLLQLRNQVFIVEQNCLYQDLDNKDNKAYHLLIYQKEIVIAYSRIFPNNITFKEASIGRVVIKKEFRSKGLGKILMEKSIESLFNLFGKQNIRIGAQRYALPFYKKFKFEPEGEVYLEDGIEHIEMLRKE